MKAIVLAAGYATRLYPLTLDRPKPLLPVAGKPMLDHVLGALAKLPLDRIYVVTNARFAPQFDEWAAGYDDSRVRVVNDGTTSPEDKLGAIGDIGFVLDREQLDAELVVVAADNLFSESLDKFGQAVADRDGPVLAVYDVGDLEAIKEFNAITIDDAGRITHFEEKPAEPQSTLTGIALYYYPRDTLPLIRQYLAEGNNPDQPGRLVEWLYTRVPFYTWRVPGIWYDIGSAASLEEADRIFSQS